MRSGRDHWLDTEMKRQRSTCTVAWMGAEDPLFVLYTSGSTGKPKGCSTPPAATWSTRRARSSRCSTIGRRDLLLRGGHRLGHRPQLHSVRAAGQRRDHRDVRVHAHLPDAGRYWQMVDDLGINIFYTSPTALRAVAQAGDNSSRAPSAAACACWDRWESRSTRGLALVPQRGRRGTVRYRRHVLADGDGRRDALVARRQTPMKPGAAGFPMPGIVPVWSNPENGTRLEGNGVSGALCMATPWPGQARTIWGDHERFKQTYFSQYPGYYFTGDGCTRDEDGYYWMTGRIDDVLNVSGHRLGTAEVESALVAHEAVAEAGVVGYPHAIKGQGIYAYVVLGAGRSGQHDAARARSRQQVRHAIGGFAMPDVLHVRAACPRHAAARSCGASCARSPPASSRASAISPRWPSPRWSSS
jgi:acetyl-CoA synthetase